MSSSHPCSHQVTLTYVGTHTHSYMNDTHMSDTCTCTIDTHMRKWQLVTDRHTPAQLSHMCSRRESVTLTPQVCNRPPVSIWLFFGVAGSGGAWEVRDGVFNSRWWMNTVRKTLTELAYGVCQAAERLGNRASNQKVAGRLPVRFPTVKNYVVSLGALDVVS